jgi:hypothetical protein
MILRTRFSRRLLLIVVAASSGMFAQEMVSRISSAGDQPVALARTSHRSWQSAESFYQDHPGVFRSNRPERPEVALTDPVESAVAEYPVHADAEPTLAQPATVPSPELVAVMAQNPFESLSGPSNDASPVDSAPPEIAYSAPFTEPSETEESSVFDPYQVAMAAEAPPVERRPASIPDFQRNNRDVLPPPADRIPDLDGEDADLLLPPWQRRPAGSPSDLAESRGSVPVATAGFHADAMRYASPEQLVRERGIERGQQLQRRIEARRLLGYSPLRPPVVGSPFTNGDQVRPVVVFMPRTVVVQQEPFASDR